MYGRLPTFVALHADSIQIASLVPPILTCLIGRNLGTSSDPLASYPLRRTAASLLKLITKRYGKSSQMLKPRLARTCLKYFLDPTKPLGSQYGGIIGLQAVGGTEVVRGLVVPNLKEYETIIKDAHEGIEEGKRKEAEMVFGVLMEALVSLEGESVGTLNGFTNGHAAESRIALEEKIGPLFAEKIVELGRPKIIKAIMEC